MFYFIFLIIGACTGTLAGLLGIGGGVIVVPALVAVFSHYQLIPSDQLMQMAVGTSLSTLIVTFLASLYAHVKHHSVHWHFVKRLMPTLIIGIIMGALIAQRLPSGFLKILFCIFLLIIACRLLLPEFKRKKTAVPGNAFIAFAAFMVGLLSSFLGIGGGVILMPFLLRCKLPMRQATGTSVACGVGIGIVATACFMLLGRSAVDLPWSTGYIYWPAFLGISVGSVFFAPLGTALAYRLPVELLKRILGLFLIVVALEMLFFR
jgi:uncharacterized membrane protein YfcA